MTDDNLWTARELSRFLQYSESTICRLVSQDPSKLPPRVGGLGRPRWVPEVARAWALENSIPPRGAGGRPRGS
ncbi:MAG: hypothetical protein EOP62_23035 [Sphingomonadales bacterium]|nr:MAG: hypothetical protein EOP62_23035 [Sphingomonadales bacterium]